MFPVPAPNLPQSLPRQALSERATRREARKAHECLRQTEQPPHAETQDTYDRFKSLPSGQLLFNRPCVDC